MFTKSKFLTVIAFSIILISCSSEDAPTPMPTPIVPVVTNFEIPTTENVVMYEININAFSASKNLQGITNRLDAIKSLGVNTIWLMPIYPVGVTNSFGSPYCVRNYKEVNPSFGTLQDLKNLVTKAHEKKIAVILDWVANHTSWDNVWMSNPTWYTHDTNGNIISPAGTNWNDVADLNFDNAEMRAAMIAAMKYWVTEANVDGFRCDAADYVPFDFWQQALTALDASTSKNLILLAEGARADHFTAGFQMNFSWDYLGAIKGVFGSGQNPSNLFATNTNENSVVPAGKRKLRFTTNHDESNNATPMTVYGSRAGALAASAITIYMQGVPMLYSGQEVGVSSSATYNGSNTINWNANSDMLLAYTKMLTFYNASKAAKKGTLQTFVDANVVMYKKTFENETIAVIANAKVNSKTITIPTELQGAWINVMTGNPQTLTSTQTLAGYQYLILKK